MNTKDWIISISAILTAIASLITAIHKIATDKKRKTAKRVKPRKLKRKR